MNKNIDTSSFPKAPRELHDKRMTALWNELVQSMDQSLWGRESHELLIEYCRHVVNAHDIAKMMHKAKLNHKGDITTAYIQNLNKLGIMHDRETKLIISLALKLRITNSGYRNDRVRKTDVQNGPDELYDFE